MNLLKSMVQTEVQLQEKNILEVCYDNTLLVKGIGGYNGKNAKTDGIKSLQEVITNKEWATILNEINVTATEV